MIKDYINGDEVIVSEEYISYSGRKIFIKDIIDFDYYHGYKTRFSGGICFTLKTRNDTLSIIVNASNSVFQRKSSTENLHKLENLANQLIPTLISFFVEYNMQKIERGEVVKIWNVRFDKNNISMRQCIFYLLTKIKVPYSDASVSLKQKNLYGLYSGVASFFYLTDGRNNESYKYSSNASDQPTQGQYIKIQALLDAFKTKELIEMYPGLFQKLQR